MLRNRPLTTFLLAATLCVDAVVWTLYFASGGKIISELSMTLYHSQLGLLAMWLVLGRCNWWLRLLALGVFLLVIVPLSSRVSEGAATCMVIVSIVAALVGGMSFLVCVLRAKNGSLANGDSMDNSTWQFSVKHLFVWTTVTALVAAIASVSDFSSYHAGSLAIQLAPIVVVPITALILLKGRHNVWFRFAGLLFATAMYGFVIEFVLYRNNDVSNIDRWILVCMTLLLAAITGIWIITVDYDIAQQRKREESQ